MCPCGQYMVHSLGGGGIRRKEGEKWTQSFAAREALCYYNWACSQQQEVLIVAHAAVSCVNKRCTAPLLSLHDQPDRLTLLVHVCQSSIVAVTVSLVPRLFSEEGPGYEATVTVCGPRPFLLPSLMYVCTHTHP